MSDATQQPQKGRRGSVLIRIRNRMIEGLFLSLPVVITFAIIHWVYITLKDVVMAPVARLVVEVVKRTGLIAEPPEWFGDYVSYAIAAIVVLVMLYVLGLLLHSRLHKAMDWVLLQVPIVTTIYAAVRKMFNTLQSQRETERFKRVVLVAFPHPGMRVPAFVTSSCKDTHTGKTILCVYVPTTPVPTSGYMLLVPEEDVTELNWDLNDTLQAIVSGGISVPPEVGYYPKSSTE